MAKLTDKVKVALDEARMLILGATILLGFDYRSFLEPGIEKMPASWLHLKLASLAAIALTIVLIMWPTSFQQIAERGEVTLRLHRFTTRVMSVALFPFALSLGLEMFMSVGVIRGPRMGAAAGALAAGAALFFWFGLELWRRRAPAHHITGPDITAPNATSPFRRQPMSTEFPEEAAPSSALPQTPLKDKINDVLTEARVVIPGAQALLGFQFIVTLMPAFEKLPGASQDIHLISLGLMALSTILLMMPAAYHRIVERGEYSEGFHRFAARALLASMVPLAAGMAGDFYVVARKVLGSASWSGVIAGAMFVVFMGAWFGYTWFRRMQSEGSLDANSVKGP